MSIIVELAATGDEHAVNVDISAPIPALLAGIRAALALPRAIADYDVTMSVDGNEVHLGNLPETATPVDVGVLGGDERLLVALKYVHVARMRLEEDLGISIPAHAWQEFDDILTAVRTAAQAQADSGARMRLLHAAEIIPRDDVEEAVADALGEAIDSSDEATFAWALDVGCSLSEDFLSRATAVDAFNVAVYQRRRGMVEAMLARGADVNAAQSSSGETALFVAVSAGPATTTLILQHGANVNVVDPSGMTPLMHAARCAATRVMKLLLNHGAAMDVQDKTGRTALAFAAGGYDSDAVRMLVKAGADTNTAGADGTTALHAAARAGRAGAVTYLLACKALPDPRCGRLQNTPLHVAAQSGFVDVIHALIRNGSDVNARNAEGDTPLALARHNRHVAAVSVLWECGGRDDETMGVDATATEH